MYGCIDHLSAFTISKHIVFDFLLKRTNAKPQISGWKQLCVTETFAVTGILTITQVITANPKRAGLQRPSGIFRGAGSNSKRLTAAFL